MAVHIEPAVGSEIALVVWIYSGVPDDAPAYHHKLDHDAVCTAVWNPQTKEAKIKALNGQVTHKDIKDLFEKLFLDYGVTLVDWERATGKRVRKRRRAPRQWISDKR